MSSRGSTPASLLPDEEARDAFDFSSDVEAKPVKKRSKTINSRRKSTPTKSRTKIKGSLGAFSNLPLDVVSEIASHADLQTVLSLSRLNKSVRSLLTTKRVADVWEQARVNSGLPKLKADNSPSLILYAELMYGTHCMACGKVTSKGPFYGLYLRFCTPCSNEKILFSNEVLPIRTSVYDCKGHERKQSAMVHADYEKFQELDSEDQREQWNHRSEERDDREDDELAMAEWNGNRIQELAAHREEIKEQRKLALQAHFRALGWTERSLNSPTFVEHSKVNVARDLSDRTIDDVYSALTIVLESERERVEAANAEEAAELEQERLDEARIARKELVKTALLSLVSNEQAQKDAGVWPLPNLEECLGDLDSVKLLYDPDEADDEPDLEGSYHSLAAELDELREQCKADLFDKYRDAIIDIQATAATGGSLSPIPPLPAPQGPDNTYTPDQKEFVLDLATTVFDCQDDSYTYTSRGCGATAPWPHIFHHVCRYQAGEPARCLRARGYNVSPNNVGLAAVLVETAGLDPATATSADMEALGRGFTCLGCKDASFGSVARTYVQALKHFSARHYFTYADRTELDLEIVYEPEDVAIARLLKASADYSNP